MSNAIFTDAGRALIAGCLANGAKLTITELVLADVPGLNVDIEPDQAAPLPPVSQIVYRAAPQPGLLTPETAVFSTILTADKGDFHINYMGLLAGSTLVAVCVMPRHLKFKSTEFKVGNSLIKNFALEVKNISDLTGITVPAAAWQWDFDDRYAAIAHNHDDRYEKLGAVAAHNTAAAPHAGKFEAAGAVAAHNTAAAPHAGKFDAAGTATGAVATHNAAADAHAGKFDTAGTATGAVAAHNSAAAPHAGKFEAVGAVAAHNTAAAPHAGKFDAAGTATGAVATHNAAADAHAGKFAAANHNHNTVYEAKGAVATHNAAADAHPDIRAQLGAGKAMFEIFSSLSGDTPPGAYPLWTGETIANCRTLYPDFWNKAIALQSAGKIRTLAAAAYNTEISTYGETGAFVIDTGAGSIRLPKIVHFVRSIADLASIGTAQNDELRAHTHTTPNGTLFVRPAVHAPGGDGDHWHKNDDGSNVTGTTGGAETRPKNVAAAMYIQVYSAAIPPSTAQAAEFVNSLTGKADRDFGNLALSAALANLGFSGTRGASGYQKLPGGLIIQWGEVTPPIKGDDITSGNWEQYKTAFPVSFPVTCFSVVAVRRQVVDGQGISVDSATIAKFNNTHFLIMDRSAKDRPFSWIAIGY